MFQPDRRLVGHERVALDAGESATGEYELAVGEETTTLTVENAGSITDDRPAIGFDLDDAGDRTAYSNLLNALQRLGR